jgi:hypothetical protein
LPKHFWCQSAENLSQNRFFGQKQKKVNADHFKKKGSRNLGHRRQTILDMYIHTFVHIVHKSNRKRAIHFFLRGAQFPCILATCTSTWASLSSFPYPATKRPFYVHTYIQGCHIFLVTKYQNRENIPNDHKIYQMAIKYFQWP